MLLSELLLLADLPATEAPRLDITGIAYDSRKVQPGNLFVAVPGFHVDGVRFLTDAFARGAAAAVINRDVALTLPEAVAGRTVAVEDTRAALPALAAVWYGFPARTLRSIGVTGTDGKTTTSFMIAAVLDAGGLPSGLFTTVAYKLAGAWEDNESRQTTPEALEVQQLLRRMLNAGCRYGVLESSSHGLELHKLDCCEYDLAVFTNLSPDHLDFHGNFDAYRAAKGRLFAMLDTSIPKGIEKLAILNADDPASEYMASRTAARLLTYGVTAPADVGAEAVRLGPDGSTFIVRAAGRTEDGSLRAPGLFNVSNALAAIATGLSQGVPLTTCVQALANWQGVPGRMQRIDAGQSFTVIVDYAHTGASFEKVLATLRPLTRSRIIAVFGCAGERGTERRARMGAVAARGADYSVVTSEDPRSEPADAIVEEIAAAMRAAGASEGSSFERVIDRRRAIERAFALAAPGDIVLLAGKGHEHSIETANGPEPWDEAAVARSLLTQSRAGGPE